MAISAASYRATPGLLDLDAGPGPHATCSPCPRRRDRSACRQGGVVHDLRHGHHDRVTAEPLLGAITLALASSGDPVWWRRLVAKRVDFASCATEDLLRGFDVPRDRLAESVLHVCAGIAVFDRSPTGAVPAAVNQELYRHWALLREATRYDAAGRPGGDLVAWSPAQGHEHRATDGYRYVARSGSVGAFTVVSRRDTDPRRPRF